MKQDEVKEKHLTLKCIQAVRKYIVACELAANDYDVNAADKWNEPTVALK